MNIEVLTKPTSTDIDFIKSGLKGFNKEFGTENFINSICITAKDKLGNSLGGAVCNIQYTSCYVDLFWIKDGSRGQGLGRAVFDALVKKSKSSGVKDIFLDTFSFQSPKFYEDLGFKKVGCLPNYPKQGINKYFYHVAIS